MTRKSSSKQQLVFKPPQDLNEIFGEKSESSERHNENNGTQGNLISNIFYTKQLTGSSIEENPNL